jgi:hypothetical protein
MAPVPKQQRTREIEYPSGDGKPVAETGPHVRKLLGTIQLPSLRSRPIRPGTRTRRSSCSIATC